MGAAMPAVGQDKSTYYTVQHPEKFAINWKAFYDRADDLTAAVRARLPHHLDLPYGRDPKQKLDLYLPASSGTGRPVFIFIHGGGFREGDRAHYGYVAGPLAARGVLTVVASYRLLPHRYPDQLNDTYDLVAWVFHKIVTYGGDPRRIYVGGHSAGAILSALVAVTTDWRQRMSLPADIVRGCAPISGPYDLRTAGGFVNDFLPDPKTRPQASPVLNIVTVPPRTVVAVGSLEEPFIKTSEELVEKIREKGGQAELVVLKGMGHDATALAAADGENPASRAILAMIEGR